MPRAWASTLNLPGRRKKQTKSKPILQTPVDGEAMAEPPSQRAGVLTPLNPALLLLFGFNKKNYESNHLNLTLSRKKLYTSYSLEK